MTWIIRDPGILGGTPCIRGTRVPLEAITWLRNHPEEWIHQ